MEQGWYRAMAASVLSLHAMYIAWVIFGAFFTRGRRLAALHVATLVYGVIIEIFGFWCPLTAFETWLEVRGGVSAYRGPFLLPPHCGRCRRLRFESMDLRPACSCPTFTRMNKRPQGYAGGDATVPRD